MVGTGDMLSGEREETLGGFLYPQGSWFNKCRLVENTLKMLEVALCRKMKV